MDLNESTACVYGYFTKPIAKVIDTICKGDLEYALIAHENKCGDINEPHFHYMCWGHIDKMRDFQKYLYGTVFKNVTTEGFKYRCLMNNYITKHKPPQNKLDSKALINFLVYCKHNGPDTVIQTSAKSVEDYWLSITEEQAINAKIAQQSSKDEYKQKKDEAMACLTITKGDKTYILEDKLKQKLALDMELDSFIESHNIINQNALWKLTKEERKFMDIKYNKQCIVDAIERYGNFMSNEGFKFTKSDCSEGLPFRYFSLTSFLADDKNNGRTYEDFRRKPMHHLLSGVMLLFKVLFENLQDNTATFMKEMEAVLNKTYNKKTVMCIIGPSNAGKTLISSMITSYVNTGLITKNGEASQFVFQDTIDKRVCHMEEAKVTNVLENDYLAFFSKNDPMQVQVKHKAPISLTERSSKPAFIMTSNADPFRDCQNQTAFRNRVCKYYFNKELDQNFIESLKKACGYSNNIPINPMHYIVLLSMLQNIPEYNFKTIKEFIEDNDFIKHFTEFMDMGRVPLDTPYTELDSKFLIEMETEKPASIEIPDLALFEDPNLQFNVKLNHKRKLEIIVDDEDEDIKRIKMDTSELGMLVQQLI